MPRSGFYRDLTREHGFEPLKVEGALPPGLAGTLYRNGPGEFGSFGRRYHHLFEGQGAISAVRFAEGSAQGAHRLVQSEGHRAERAAGKPLYGSLAARGRRIANLLRRRDNNTANVNAMAWQRRVFALRDVAKPIEISAQTLETIGETDLRGVVVESFSAHPHFVAARNAIYGFGTRIGRKIALDLFEFPARGSARCLGSLPIAATLVHDFAATPQHLVFFLGPARFEAARALLGEARPERLVRWEPEQPGEVLVVPIDAPERAVRFPVEPFFVWHFANAFERDGGIVVDFVRHRDASAVGTMRDEAARDGAVLDMNEGELCRATLDWRARRMRVERVWATPCEFPRVDSRGEGDARRYVWLTASDAGRASIARFDLERAAPAHWVLPHGQHASEPIFAARRGGEREVDGWTLVLVYDETSETSHVAVLDASAPERGPLARVHFDHHVPLTLHGTWVET